MKLVIKASDKVKRQPRRLVWPSTKKIIARVISRRLNRVRNAQGKPDRSAAHDLCDEARSSIVMDQNTLSACGLDLRDGLRLPHEIDDSISTFFSEGESDPFTPGIILES